MIPLKTTQRVLMWLCIVSFDNKFSMKAKIRSIALSFAVGGMIFAQLVASATFFLKFHSTDLESSLYAVYQIFAWMPILYIFAIALLSRRKITAVLAEMTNIYDTITNAEAFQFIKLANDKSEWLWKLYFKYAMGYNAVGAAVVGSVLSTVMCLIFRKRFQRDILYLQFKLILPWNQYTPLGYVGETIFSVLTCEAYLIVNGAIMFLFISLAVHHEAFYKIFRLSVRKMGQSQKECRDKENLRNLIIFHNMAKSWFFESAAVYSLLVMILLICAMLALSCLLFQIDMEFKHPDLSLPFLVLAAVVNISNLFVYCYFGKLASVSYEKMAHCLYESNWQRLSTHLQKYIVLMMGNMHRPLFYHGFDVFILNLSTFSKLLKTIITYYMMLKTVTSN
ncbi:odorant receptor 47a-like [Sitodiplosis mosellana]|uniref:odorant receptor 47a-like n=1 Tax=Sitodiplosis mosellana TaxID=263140 RepID=UPI0024440D3F|nr:odorant receptor 47a-like [Sitodiplosis mosellana]